MKNTIFNDCLELIQERWGGTHFHIVQADFVESPPGHMMVVLGFALRCKKVFSTADEIEWVI